MMVYLISAFICAFVLPLFLVLVMYGLFEGLIVVTIGSLFQQMFPLTLLFYILVGVPGAWAVDRMFSRWRTEDGVFYQSLILFAYGVVGALVLVVYMMAFQVADLTPQLDFLFAVVPGFIGGVLLFIIIRALRWFAVKFWMNS
ncbi:hypothetical protein B0H94_11045 [Salsuginibacillus halophilus]|uniref:Uncharacterized protein n=1 Tax=Salsuginibacillus halophilus TaxID=517424 RepID=A0A2P8HBH9_9BACI|nr:hypothetical protein [Salsuginibacillus halophilus]PSL43569.1 hypothetical protein B0H94_11045 [Salsuginibacillus halophilus]